MEQKYVKTKEYIEGLISRKIYNFDRTQKATIIDLMIQEASADMIGEMWADFGKEDIKYITDFLKKFTAITAILAQSLLIDKLYNNMSRDIEQIIDDVIMEQTADFFEDEYAEHRFFDNLERARDMNVELNNWKNK